MSESYEVLGEVGSFRPKLIQWETGGWLALSHVVSCAGGEDDEGPWLSVVTTNNASIQTRDPDVITRFFAEFEMT